MLPKVNDVADGTRFEELAVIANASCPDVPPPGAGFVTLISTVPGVATIAAVYVAVNSVLLT